MKQGPVYRELVLAGGGHSHVLLLRRWGMQPLPGVRVTLVSPEPLTPYSGMLPGHLAGHYSHEDMHIDLVRLCQWAGARLLLDRVTGLDADRRRLSLASHPALDYDLLSLDTGATPAVDVAGVDLHAIPVKPIAGFLAHWQNVCASLRNSDRNQTLVMVGGGAGSVESLLGMAHAIRHDPGVTRQPRLLLLTRNSSLLQGYPSSVIRAVNSACASLAVEPMLNCAVLRVEAGILHANDARTRVEFDHLFWCTQAGAPPWLQDSGLALSATGFVKVDAALNSTTHPEVFAAGDVSHFSPQGPAGLPKAGVYAVRQAPVLFANLRHALLGEPLENYRPQQKFLSLLALGDRQATGHRGWLSFTGSRVWRWKDRIDRAFMHRFRDLPALAPMPEQTVPLALIPASEQAEIRDPLLRCGGCGGKLGGGTLAAVLRDLRGAYVPEDACSSVWPAATLVQSIDQLKAPLDDPWLFGRLATRHALNDLFAVNASPHSLLLAVGLPYAARAVQQRELRQVLLGVLSVCDEEQLILLGGHSAESQDSTLTMTVNGSPGALPFSKRGARAGQLVVLGRPLGSGIVFAALMQGRCPGPVLAQALTQLDCSPRAQVQLLAAIGTSTCTDVSGFGLLGHLGELLEGSGLKATLDLSAMPLLPGAAALAEAGVQSSLLPQNAGLVLDSCASGGGWLNLNELAKLQGSVLWPVLLDPQTCGGLLALIDPEHAAVAQAEGFTVIGAIE